MAVQAVCDGNITIAIQGYATCDTGWLSGAYIAPFNISDLDPVLISMMVGSGFFVLLPLWGAIIGGRAIINAIR